MKVKYNGRFFEFRSCDTRGTTQEELQKQTNETGYIQYEPGAAWLVVRGVGYGWEVRV